MWKGVKYVWWVWRLFKSTRTLEHAVQPSTLYHSLCPWARSESQCDQEAFYPTANMRWGLVATKGAWHWIHVDSDRLGINVDVLYGRQWWLLYTPSECFNLTNFRDVDHFFYNFNVTCPPDNWAVKAVYLQPGTQLWVAWQNHSLLAWLYLGIILGLQKPAGCG